MSASPIAPVTRNLSTEVLTNPEAEDQWQIYKAIRETETELAAHAWHRLLKAGEKRVLVQHCEASIPDASPEYGFSGLTKPGITEETNAPPYLEAKAVFMWGMPNIRGMRLPAQYRVNYHGHIYAHVTDCEGEPLPWDPEGEAFHVEERTRVIVEAVLTSSLADAPESAAHAEMEVAGGTERAMVPFQVEVEGYPLRFLEQSRYEKLEAPLHGRSEPLRFPVHPESLIFRKDDNSRVPVWINVRQHNVLIQCLCVPLVINAKDKPIQE